MLDQSYFHTMKFNVGDYELGDLGLGDYELGDLGLDFILGDFDLIPICLISPQAAARGGMRHKVQIPFCRHRLR